MQILIIEDETHNQNRLKRLLIDIDPTFKIVGICSSIQESIEVLKSNRQLNLIISDICLTDGLCFEIFKSIDVSIPIIFTTAFDEYAIKAFEYNSIDYLLKPIKKEELQRALKKLKLKADIDLRQEINDIYRQINTLKKPYRNRFLLPHKDGFRTVKTKDIHHISIDNKITYIHLNEIKIAVSFSIEDLEEQLDPTMFFRANRQYIIHVDSIQYISNYFNGKLKVILSHSEQTEIIISKEKAKLFKEWLNN
jgi:two-component system LytT family response regulator